MHIFVSSGEPSGDLHAANLIRALRSKEPNLRITGFGGPRSRAAGAELLFDLTMLAVMWFGAVLKHLATFFRLFRRAEEHFQSDRPDVVVLVDNPGFNFVLAKRAHAAGIPVYFFVPPQLWGWAGWRVKKVRRWFTGVFTALPFEEKWYRERGAITHYVGHPYFDELASQQLHAGFLTEQRAKPGRIVALLPGSRNQEVAKNFADMLLTAKKVRAACPEARFLVASFSEAQAAAARTQAESAGVPIEFHVGRTPEIIELAECCLSVSGSVSLEMMYREKPAVILYKCGLLFGLATLVFRKVKYITLVNLLAEEEVYPEFPTTVDRSKEMAAHLVRWLNDAAARAGCVEKLRRLKVEVAQPGACDRSAEFLLQAIRAKSPLPRAA